MAINQTYSSLTMNQYNLNIAINAAPPAADGVKWLFDAAGFSKGLIDVGAKAVSLASGIGAIVSAGDTVYKIAKLTGLVEEVSLDEIFSSIETVNQKLTKVLEAVEKADKNIQLAWAAERATDLTETLAMIRSCLPATQHVLSTRPQKEGPDVLLQQMLANAEAKSGEALMRLDRLDSAYWYRPAFEDMVRLREWEYMTDDRPSPNEAGMVFDWRLTLPVYLQAITVRLLVLRAMELATNRSWIAKEAPGWIKFNDAVYYTMITNVRMKYKPGPRIEGDHTGAYRWVGAVDLLTGYHHFVCPGLTHSVEQAVRNRLDGLDPLQDKPTDDSQNLPGAAGKYINVRDIAPDITPNDAMGGGGRPSEAFYQKQAYFAASVIFDRINPIAQQLLKLNEQLVRAISESHTFERLALIRERILVTDLTVEANNPYLDMFQQTWTPTNDKATGKEGEVEVFKPRRFPK